MILDATNLILGRFASKVAKLALQGEEVRIINCEKAYVIGNKKKIFEKYKHRQKLGSRPNKGPFLPKKPNRLIRKTIKSMLPKNKRGKSALGRVKCYIGMPEELEDKEAETMEEASTTDLKTPNRTQLEKLCLYLGWEKRK